MDIAFLDFDFDGKIDVLTMSNINYNGYGLRLYLNKENGFIESAKNYFAKLPNNLEQEKQTHNFS